MRRVYAVLGAMVLAVVIGRTAVSPLCAIYTPSDPQWYLFFCYLENQAEGR